MGAWYSTGRDGNVQIDIEENPYPICWYFCALCQKDTSFGGNFSFETFLFPCFLIFFYIHCDEDGHDVVDFTLMFCFFLLHICIVCVQLAGLLRLLQVLNFWFMVFSNPFQHASIWYQLQCKYDVILITPFNRVSFKVSRSQGKRDQIRQSSRTMRCDGEDDLLGDTSSECSLSH